MAKYQYVILASAKPGQEQEFLRWYDEQHLADVLRIPGVVSAKRFDILNQKTTKLESSGWHSLAIYEIESDEPHAVIERISAAAGTASMPLIDALTRTGMVQILAQQSKSLP